MGLFPERCGRGFRLVMHSLGPLETLSMSYVDESVCNSGYILFLHSKIYIEY